MKTIKQPIKGTIIKVDTRREVDTYTLDNGYSWSDSAGRWTQGDVVIVSPYIMGTVRVEKAA